MGPEQCDVVVIGGGISGLSTAYWLRKSGIDVRVLESDSDVGGTMKTVKEEGYLVETGPNSALETTPLMKELVQGAGLDSEFVYADPAGKNRFILRDGVLHALPLSPLSFLKTNLFSSRAKIRLLGELFVGKADKEETLAEFVTRRLGREFLDYAIDPFVAGVFAARPDQLSVRAAFPKLYALEERYGGLLKGMVKGRRDRKRRAETSKDRAESFSFRSGMQEFPFGLKRFLGDRVLCNAKATGIADLTLLSAEALDEHGARDFRIEYMLNGKSSEIESDAVVLAIPAPAAAALMAPFSRKVSGVLHSINYSPVVSLFLGFRTGDIRHPLNGFGFLVPSVEKRSILGCLWSSSLFHGRSPGDHSALTVFAGGARQPELTDLSDTALIDLAVDDLKTIMEIQGKPLYCRLTRWKRAIPQYEVGYGEKMNALTAFEEEHRGIFFCSNYRNGISVGDCVMSAHSTAEQVAGFMSRAQR